MRVNFLGAVYAVEAVLPGMLERKRGHLVAVSSLAGFGGLPKTAAYAASKAALRVFFESLRLDLKDDPVDVTVISPGYVRASETSKYVAKRPFLVELDDAVERMYGAIAARRLHCFFRCPSPPPSGLAKRYPAACTTGWRLGYAGTGGSRLSRPRSTEWRPGHDGP